jgi:putative Holliday junction resolvase
MRTLGIDHGDIRIGLALSDEGGLIARPLQVINHIARQADAQTIARIAADKAARLIVVGLPTDSEGDVGPQARKVMRWAEALAEATPIKIYFWDESFSSVEADGLAREHKAGGRREANDAIAAAVMLQSYLDAHRPAE